MKKLLDETIFNKEAKHLEEIKALVTEEELDHFNLKTRNQQYKENGETAI